VVLTALSLICGALAQGVVLLEQPQLSEQVRFQQELGLSLSAVELQPAPSAFESSPLAAQLDVVRPLLKAQPGRAVVWLGGDAAKLWVSVAFVEDERAVIRMIDLPREPDPLPELVLSVRELITAAYAEEPAVERSEPPSPEPEPLAPPASGPADALWAGAKVGVLMPSAELAGGTRGAAALHVFRDLGGAALGAELGAQLGAEQTRLSAGLSGRGRLLVLGMSADWVRAEWALPLQPRVSAGFWHRWESGLFGQASLLVHPFRDMVALDGQGLYDTGWTSLGIFLGWERKISAR
jgi:hypothetical protein